MQGILSAAGYVPYRRLDRGAITQTFGAGGGKGARAVAGYDEDTTTLGVEAARLALRGAAQASPRNPWFATVAPAYLDKTNATTIHAALRLDTDVLAAERNRDTIDAGCERIETQLERARTEQGKRERHGVQDHRVG